MPVPEDFRIETVQTSQPGDGELLIRNFLVSVDPGMRNRLTDRATYAPPIPIGGIIEGASEADAATGWCLMISATSTLALAYLPQDVARRIASRPDLIMCGIFAPMGRAVRDGDVYTVTGTWPWGSNSPNSHWMSLAATHAARASAEVVTAMYQLAGGSSVFLTSPLQRRFRDAHVATQHMMVAPSTYELTGRALVRLDVDATFL